MHRGRTFLDVTQGESDSEDDDAKSTQLANSTILRGVACLILCAAMLFVIAPSHHIDAQKRLDSQDHHLSKIRNIEDDPRKRTRFFPARLQNLLAHSHVVGSHLKDVKEGKITVEEAIHAGGLHNDVGSSGHIGAGNLNANHKTAPMTYDEVVTVLQDFLKKLNSSNIKHKHATFHGIWSAYHDLILKYLYPFDRDYLRRMPNRREDGSIFLSVVTYRDEFCASTLGEAFAKAKNPHQLFVGLVQQNCDEAKCRSGVLEGGKMADVGPDPDCYEIFCSSAEGKKYCANNQVRLLKVKESESLGPYMARYFASKLWMGEQWYMQIDSHMTFILDWDHLSIDMLNQAPSKKPVISHYPPPHTADLAEKAKKNVPAPRLCGPIFATSDLESQIVRLEGSYNYDSVKLKKPRFAPFVAAGYLVAHSDLLKEVPFDPFLGYIFMGEEILMSARLWTSGYDIFSPTVSLTGHHYVRNHKPKFWESIHRTFSFGVHNPLQMLVLNRVKYQLGYPESARDMIKPKSLFSAIEQYSMGTSRPLDEYLRIVGLDMNTKEVRFTKWCETGTPPPGFEKYRGLYDT